MLSIRLTRTGKTHEPHYRIVVQERRSKLNGKSVEIVGHYHPAQKDKTLVVDQDRTRYWLSKGAQPSDTVTNLLVKVGVLDESQKVHHFYTPKPKEETLEQVEETAEVATEEPAGAEEAVTEETNPSEIEKATEVAEAPATEE